MNRAMLPFSCAIMTCTRTVLVNITVLFFSFLFFASTLVDKHPDEDVCSVTGNIFIDGVLITVNSLKMHCAMAVYRIGLKVT
jgi:hypothetical protein